MANKIISEQELKQLDADNALKEILSLLKRGGTRTYKKPKVNGYKKIGRNDPCPCSSGKKYKKCCLI